MSQRQFMGYRRPDGSVGVRNYVAIIPSCGCSLHAATMIANQVPGAVLIGYNGGCSQTDADVELAKRILSQYGRHPNVIGSLVISLGCETLDAHDLYQRIKQGWAPTELLVIQELGGTRTTVAKGVALATDMVTRGAEMTREPCSVSDLTIGLECGGSDATSGMAANPAIGAMTDLVVDEGGKVILAETSELLGAEHVLDDLADNADVAERLARIIEECEEALKATGEDFMGKQPAPGNVQGGITTVEEKALGDARKGGSSPIVDVLQYGDVPALPGLSFMDTPGNDPASVTALVAAGAQLVTFTTGRGNPMGNPITPVVKITGNAQTFARMGEDMDIDASTIITGQETTNEVGERILQFCLDVAEGQLAAAELLEHAEFDLLRYGPIY